MSSYVCFDATMDFASFVITFGVVGAWLLLGVMTRTLWLLDDVKAVGRFAVPLLFMGGIGAFTTSYHPVVEPLWVHYLLIVAVPFAVGHIGLVLVTGRHSRVPGEEMDSVE